MIRVNKADQSERNSVRQLALYTLISTKDAKILSPL